MKRKILVTGGSRGLGQAIKTKFENAGHQVLAPTREELDLSQSDSVESYVLANQKQNIDVLINNAGINYPNPIDKLSFDTFSKILDVNLKAPYLLIQGFSKGMRSRNWGRIINIGSVFSLASRPGRSAYSASKFGLNGLTKTAALELAPHGILVNCICPGFFKTDMTSKANSQEEIKMLLSRVALGRRGEPPELAELAFFLGTELNSFITGQEIVIDGGLLAGLPE